MGVSEILDVAIGLVLVWFLLSIAVSGINEAFSWLTRMRAKQLWRTLAGIVDSTVKPQALPRATCCGASPSACRTTGPR